MYPANPKKKALCVGIAYTGQRGPYGSLPEDFELPGAHSDVQKVCGLLTTYYDYSRDNITILQDSDGYEQPTKSNIIAAMEDMARDARPGENLFFFFAGHGDQITNIDGTEIDNKDEIILPLDWKLDETLPREDRDRYSVMIIDDEMNDILVKKLPAECRLTALFDSCHSGTLLDLPFSRFFGPRSKSPPLERYVATAPQTTSPEPSRPSTPMHPPRPKRGTRVVYDDPNHPTRTYMAEPQSPDELARINRTLGRGPLELSFTLALALVRRGRMDPYWRKGTWILRGETLDDKVNTSPGNAQVISWSACSDAQSGYEYLHENRSGGVMVQAFVSILEAKQYRSYRDILKCLGERLRSTCIEINRGKEEHEWIMQEPQLGSQQKPDLDKLFAP